MHIYIYMCVCVCLCLCVYGHPRALTQIFLCVQPKYLSQELTFAYMHILDVYAITYIYICVCVCMCVCVCGAVPTVTVIFV